MEAIPAIEVRRVPSSADLEKPGDFVMIPKREPISHYQTIEIEPPTGRVRRLWWKLFGRRHELRQIIEIQWPEYDAIILNCSHCNQPVATTKEHRIVSLEPLTIEAPVMCPYSRDSASRTAMPTVVFNVKDGKIIPA